MLLTLLPIACAGFLAFVPNFDLASIRQIVLATFLVWLGMLFLPGNLALDQTILLFGVGSALGITLLIEHENLETLGLAFFIVLLLLLSLSSAAILTASTSGALILSHVSIWLLLYLVAQLGGPFRGGLVFQTALLFLVVDWISLSFPDWIIFSIFVRLMIPFVAPFSNSLVDTCPRPLLVLWITIQSTLGANLIFHAHPDLQQLSTAIMVGAIFAVLWSIYDKKRKTFAVASMVLLNSVFLTSPSASVISLGVMCCAVTILSSGSRHILWAASLGLFVPLPSFGIGAALWPIWKSGFTEIWLAIAILYVTAWTYHFSFPETVSNDMRSTRAWVAWVFVAVSCSSMSWFL